jgi:hypothetical protein
MSGRCAGAVAPPKSGLPDFVFSRAKSAIADLVGSALCAEHLRVTEHAFADAYCAGAAATGGLVCFFAAAGALACAVVLS